MVNITPRHSRFETVASIMAAKDLSNRTQHRVAMIEAVSKVRDSRLVYDVHTKKFASGHYSSTLFVSLILGHRMTQIAW
jgi:hypothetical protein